MARGAYRYGCRDTASTALGHNDPATIGTYVRSEDLQGEGGFHTSTGFVAEVNMVHSVPTLFVPCCVFSGVLCLVWRGGELIAAQGMGRGGGLVGSFFPPDGPPLVLRTACDLRRLRGDSFHRTAILASTPRSAAPPSSNFHSRSPNRSRAASGVQTESGLGMLRLPRSTWTCCWISI